MKDILVLLVLLNTQTTKVCCQPYKADSDGNCQNPATEYHLDDSNMCCKRCHPGQRLKQKCSETTETVCEQCPTGQYLEGWNYSPNCLTCKKCKPAKGLREIQSCSSTTMSKCGCQPGSYCIMGFDDPYCAECTKYSLCPVGYGVFMQGKADSNVKCKRCLNGTFSDIASHTDRCRPHTNCQGRVVVKEGDATSDTVCGSSIEDPDTETVFPPARTMMSTVSTSESKDLHGPTDSTLSISRPSVSEAIFNSTKSPPPNTVSDSKLVAATVSVTGVILLFICVILLFLWKTVWERDDARPHPKVDANGNCETGDKISQDYSGETQLTSFTVTSPEQQCLLGKGGACSDQSQCSNNTETLTRSDCCNSNESIGPLQSTIALHSPHSALSEPMTLLSNTESVTPQTSIPTQSSSQPTSPQIISPVTTSPHVNVNITFHIGNGSGGTPSVMPTDLRQVDSKLPFGEEEESFSIPQQEAGKQSLMSVQETASYSA